MSAEKHTTWPHIPTIQWEFIHSLDFSILGIDIHISNTVLSTWVFMFFLFICSYFFKISLKKEWWFWKTTGLIIVWTLYKNAISFMWDAKYAKRVLFLTWWMFIFILLSNIFSLFLDWILLIANPELKLHSYLRPINSDLNTTFWLSLSIIMISHFVAIYKKWLPKYMKSYIFNFSGHNFIEKVVNVFLGWLHFIWEFVKTFSLSLRLFGNIFAWAVLISMLAFLGWMIHIYWIKIWELFVLPFWFFELFVAFVQATVFFILSSIYLTQAVEEHH